MVELSGLAHLDIFWDPAWGWIADREIWLIGWGRSYLFKPYLFDPFFGHGRQKTIKLTGDAYYGTLFIHTTKDLEYRKDR